MAHGGMLIVVDQPESEFVAETLNFKYRSSKMDYSWYLLRDYMVTLARIRLANDIEKKSHSLHLAKSLRERVREFADCIAQLSAIDGAVVLSSRLELLGFGAEIIVKSELSHVWFADSEKEVAIDNFGTRHRSAFRLVKTSPTYTVFVISQDGALKIVKRVNDRVCVWDELGFD